MKKDNLRGCIVSKFHTVNQFSKVVNWSNRKAYDIVNGKQEPTGKDIEVMCNALDIEVPEIIKSLFFSA